MSSDTPQRIEFTGELSPSGEWPPDWLRSAIQDQLDEQDLTGQVDVDELASAVGERITTVDRSRVNDIDSTIRSYEERLSALEARESGGGTAPEGVVSDLEEMQARVEKTRRTLEVASNPEHVSHIPTGSHDDSGFHAYGAWGCIVSTPAPVHWRETTVNAEESGTTTLEVYEMDYVEGETYDLGEKVATRDLQLDGGEQTVYPEVTLPSGACFITRDSEDPTADEVVGLKRVGTGVDWAALNESHSTPLTFETAWQIGRQPGTEDFQYYRDQGWHRTLHNWADWEVGYMSPEA